MLNTVTFNVLDKGVFEPSHLLCFSLSLASSQLKLTVTSTLLDKGVVCVSSRGVFLDFSHIQVNENMITHYYD